MSRKREDLSRLKTKWAATRIVVKYNQKELQHKPVIVSHKQAHEMILSVWDKELINIHEELMAFYFTRANRLIGYRLISSGSSHKCLIDLKFLVSLALHTMASHVIIAHNHPSGEVQPSMQDKEVTARVKQALALIDVKLIDHLIISENDCYSFGVEGEL